MNYLLAINMEHENLNNQETAQLGIAAVRSKSLSKTSISKSEFAEKAMQEHKQKALDEFNEMYAIDNEFGLKFGEHEDWCI